MQKVLRILKTCPVGIFLLERWCKRNCHIHGKVQNAFLWQSQNKQHFIPPPILEQPWKDTSWIGLGEWQIERSWFFMKNHWIFLNPHLQQYGIRKVATPVLKPGPLHESLIKNTDAILSRKNLWKAQRTISVFFSSAIFPV